MATKKTSSSASVAKIAAAKASPAKASEASAASAGDDEADENVAAGASAVAPAKAPSLRIKDLVSRVAEATGAAGGKRKAVKEMVEATLMALGDALSRGEDLNLPGFGRTRIARSSEKDGASMMTLKVRRGAHRKKEAKEPLAEDGEDS